MSMPTNYDRGRRHEDRAAQHLRENGYVAQRIAGSHGPFDVVAINASGVRLIQIKAQGATSEQARRDLAALAVPPCVSLELWERRRGGWIVEVVNGASGQ
jgi:Holliday junction resolvase-like predicted endonuclease